jgi:hypothetical protein
MVSRFCGGFPSHYWRFEKMRSPAGTFAKFLPTCLTTLTIVAGMFPAENHRSET